MYKLVSNYCKHVDDRGAVTGLLNIGNWKEVNFVLSEAGCVRGNHYHKETIECFIILSGKVKVSFRRLLNNSEWEIDEQYFCEGQVFIIEPFVEHQFFVEERTEWINLLSQPFDKENPDFHKYADT